MTPVEAEKLFASGTSLAVIGGKVSRNLECMDFDNPSLFSPFLKTLTDVAPDLKDKLVIRQTPSGGYHLIYRSQGTIQGNQKLATSKDGKETWIETRGEGGYFLTTPSPNYSIIKNSLLKTPILTSEEIKLLHNIAISFNEHAVLEYQPKEQQIAISGTRPGDDFNQRTDFRQLLENNGWESTRRTGPGGEHWTRPDKKHGTSATLKDGCLYVFSSNAGLPLGPNDAFSVYAHFNHHGDYSAATRELGKKGYGEKIKSTSTRGERGERGESVTPTQKKTGRTRGEQGRILKDEEISHLLKKADVVLKPTTGTSAQYPIEALGPLVDVTRSLAENGQVPEEMAGQCVLGTAALLAQSKANVKTLAGTKPLSLFLLTVADSGEGKSTADDAAQHSVIEWQREAARDYFNETRQAEAERGKSKDIIREPYRIMRDGTVEGIRRSFRQGVPSQGVFSSEAAIMLAGYGMSQDNRAKSAGNFNSLWDCGEISVARGIDGRVQLYDRRLSLHWLIQPDVAFSAINDPMLSNIGFWPRFLMACPPPSKPLDAKMFEPGKHAAIKGFWAACSEMLKDPLGEDCSFLPTITPSREAEKLACKFYEKMQQEAKNVDGILTGVKPFAIRGTEHAFRIAAVLAAFSGQDEIDAGLMKNGIQLAAYSLETWRSVFGDRDEQNGKIMALKLYAWLLKQPGQQASGIAVLRIGPKSLRSKVNRDTALAILQQIGLIDNERDVFYVVQEVKT
jgi:hypothetical protein